jgi:large subunit ribosomal protein L10
MKRSEKESIVTEVADMVSRAKGMYFTDFTGLTVAEATELRTEFRKAGIEYRVVKNTLVKRALKKIAEYDSLDSKLVGPTGIAFGYQDPVLPAKVIKKFRDKSKKLDVKACVIGVDVFDASKFEELASLPSREEVIASVMGTLTAPVSGIVGVLNAVMRDIVGLVEAIEKKKSAHA